MKYISDNALLLKEWNWNKNNILNLYPNQLTLGSGKRVWWMCNNGHEWYASVYNRAHGRGCPYCTNKLPVVGVNDLATLFPKIANEWNYEKNNDLSPEQFKPKSSQKVWWKCKNCGCEWQATISNRTKGSGCPDCAKGISTSVPELKLYYYIKKYFTDAIWTYTNEFLNHSELDIFIPSLKIAIEYDGGLWHQNTEKDLYKDQLCKNNDILLFRIREPRCPLYDSTCIFMYLKDLSESNLTDTIVSFLKINGIENPDINFDRDLQDIEKFIYHKKQENSLAELFPHIASEWDTIKNGTLTPEHVLAHSGRRVWWICEDCNNGWITSIDNRTRGYGCPKCAREKTINAASKYVYCIELNKIFISLADAARQTNATHSRIGACCKDNSKSTGRDPVTNERLHWYYVFDQQLKDGTIIPGAITLGIIKKEAINCQLATRN